MLVPQVLLGHMPAGGGRRKEEKALLVAVCSTFYAILKSTEILFVASTTKFTTER
jgi:hypothetical protein